MSKSTFPIHSANIRSRLVFILAFILPVIALAACSGTGNLQDTFDTRGPVARDQADLFNFVFVIAVVVFVLVEGAIIYIALKYRSRRNSKLPRQVHGNNILEITWTIIPAIIIVVVAIPTINGIWTTTRPPEEGLPVQAIGHQWWFEFRYPEQGIITANEMHIPAGEDILIDLTSQDVIHSFWVPKLGGKLDMVPVNENQLWLRAEMPENGAPTEVLYGQCAEFCGLAHAHMKFRVIVHTPEDFTRWATDWFVPIEPPQPNTPEATGRLLFLTNCSTCHGHETNTVGSYDDQVARQNVRWASWESNPTTSQLVSAPDLTYFGDRLTIGAGEEPLTRESLIAWIKNPAVIKPGTRMQQNAAVYRTDETKANSSQSINRVDTSPNIKLSNSEVASIADYLLSLKADSTGGESVINTNTPRQGSK